MLLLLRLPRQAAAAVAAAVAELLLKDEAQPAAQAGAEPVELHRKAAEGPEAALAAAEAAHLQQRQSLRRSWAKAFISSPAAIEAWPSR